MPTTHFSVLYYRAIWKVERYSLMAYSGEFAHRLKTFWWVINEISLTGANLSCNPEGIVLFKKKCTVTLCTIALTFYQHAIKVPLSKVLALNSWIDRSQEWTALCVSRKKKEINLTVGTVPSPGGSEQCSAALCRAAAETYRMHFVCLPRKSSRGNFPNHFPGNNLAAYSTQRLLSAEVQEKPNKLSNRAENKIC